MFKINQINEYNFLYIIVINIYNLKLNKSIKILKK